MPSTSHVTCYVFTQSSPPDQHDFAYFHPPSYCIKVFTYRSFLFKLRLCLSSFGFTPSDYAGHYFRRGGASDSAGFWQQNSPSQIFISKILISGIVYENWRVLAVICETNATLWPFCVHSAIWAT